jgi:hypothetical protein
MYPAKPILGTINTTKPILKMTLTRLNTKVILVFPSPWRILIKVPEMYKKGQTKDNALI